MWGVNQRIVGDFTTLLLDINPTYTLTGYPVVWTQFSVTISGLGGPTAGRLALRYFVENGGPDGENSDYIGIDTFQYNGACGPTPTPRPTPTPTLGNYPDASVPLSGDTTVTPNAAPANATNISVSTSTNFKGKLEGDPVTGVVRVTNAHPAGSYPVTVTAFDSGGAPTTKMFMLTVTTPVMCNPVAFAAPLRYGLAGPPSGGSRRFQRRWQARPRGCYLLRTRPRRVYHVGQWSGQLRRPTRVANICSESVAVGDFNGDGKQDLALANSLTTSRSCGAMVGAISASPATSMLAVMVWSSSIAVGDFNGDGKQDIAVSH